MSLVEILRSLGQPRWAVWDASPSMSLVEIFTFDDTPLVAWGCAYASAEAERRSCILEYFPDVAWEILRLWRFRLLLLTSGLI